MKIATDGNGRYLMIKDNKFQMTNQKSMAQKFKDSTSNSCLETLPVMIRKFNWHFEPLNNSKKNRNSTKKSDGIHKKVTNSNTIDKVISQLEEMNMLVDGIESKDKLSAKLSVVDCKISDIEHYIEFENFNACEGYKLCKAIKNLKIERREIKNQIDLLDIINNNKTFDSDSNKKIISQIKKIYNKTYTPRVLTNLFSESEKVNIV